MPAAGVLATAVWTLNPTLATTGAGAPVAAPVGGVAGLTGFTAGGVAGLAGSSQPQ